MFVTGNEVAPPSARLLDKSDLAVLLGCSKRHIDRLVDSGQLPTPVKLGALVRWPSNVVQNWIDAGCPPRTKGTGR